MIQFNFLNCSYTQVNYVALHFQFGAFQISTLAKAELGKNGFSCKVGGFKSSKIL